MWAGISEVLLKNVALFKANRVVQCLTTSGSKKKVKCSLDMMFSCDDTRETTLGDANRPPYLFFTQLPSEQAGICEISHTAGLVFWKDRSTFVFGRL